MQLTEELFNSLGEGWKGVSVKEKEGKNVLVVSFETRGQSDTFLSIIETNTFKLQVSIDKETKEYSLVFTFGDDKPVFGIKTGRTIETYPKFGLFKESNVNFIAVGVLDGEGKSFTNTNYLPLQYITID